MNTGINQGCPQTACMNRKSMREDNSYPFTWMDEVVEVTLHPGMAREKPRINYLEKDLSEQFRLEAGRIFAALKSQTFGLFSNRKVRIVADRYLSAVQLLLSQARIHETAYPKNSARRPIIRDIIGCLEGLELQIQKRYGTLLTKSENSHLGNSASPQIFKMLCRLTVDQLGIILRAADDAKVIVSNSISMIFKTVVPYLSTENRKDISWDSMRSNSYHPEESDKQIAIEALEKLINKIRDYK
ncbi:MAG: hypothetical protein JWR38_5230 [Mucilaginibacter sp.]|nr:hypothetical protein [Mucilaginibacter sp.]